MAATSDSSEIFTLSADATTRFSAKQSLSFAVSYAGARAHYAIPAILAKAGMLSRFYTDAVGNLGTLAAVDKVVPQSWRPPALRRLLGRKIPSDIPAEKVVTVTARALAGPAVDRLIGSFGAYFPGAWVQDNLRGSVNAAIRAKVLSDGFGGANAYYGLDSGDLPIIEEAKRRGMCVVYEQIITPTCGRILREESARYQGLEPQASEELVESDVALDGRVWNAADLVLSPSEFVSEAMISLGCPREKIGLVPYGLPRSWVEQTAAPVPGRVLCVGTVGLRKGNHYLAEATRLLRDRGARADVRVVGPPSTPSISSSPLFHGPTYVGLVPRAEVAREFSKADVFAFPTLAEGCALAHLEAMAFGVPVITTYHCGTVVRDGVEGFIVPIRDARTLADRIQLLISDRALRDRMSQAARERAMQFLWSNYADNLLGNLRRARLGSVVPQA